MSSLTRLQCLIAPSDGLLIKFFAFNLVNTFLDLNSQLFYKLIKLLTKRQLQLDRMQIGPQNDNLEQKLDKISAHSSAMS